MTITFEKEKTIRVVIGTLNLPFLLIHIHFKFISFIRLETDKLTNKKVVEMIIIVLFIGVRSDLI